MSLHATVTASFVQKRLLLIGQGGIERSPVEGGMHSAVSLYTTSSVQAGREGIRSG